MPLQSGLVSTCEQKQMTGTFLSVFEGIVAYTYPNSSVETFFKPKPIQEYNILAADGSQIYPDRHEGVDAFLINIGLTDFNYNNNVIYDYSIYSYVNYIQIKYVF